MGNTYMNAYCILSMLFMCVNFLPITKLCTLEYRITLPSSDRHPPISMSFKNSSFFISVALSPLRGWYLSTSWKMASHWQERGNEK